MTKKQVTVSINLFIKQIKKLKILRGVLLNQINQH
jgi:hypothetical protein